MNQEGAKTTPAAATPATPAAPTAATTAATAAAPSAPAGSRSRKGAWIWIGNGVGTLIFSAVILSAAAAGGRLDFLAMVVSLVFFALGCAVFLWAFVVVVERSRTKELSVAGAFMLAEGVDRRHRFIFWSQLGVQTVAAFVAAGIRLYTPAAFGILVPVFGLGMMSLWGAKHARFPAKLVSAGAPRSA